IPTPTVSYTTPAATGSLSYTPVANANGSSTITVTITDDGNQTTTRTFTVVVTAVNDLPTITAIAPQTTNEDTPTAPIAFTVDDVETPAAALTVTATSSNTTLVPDANIALGGSGASRTIALTPALNQFGTTTITVTVSDGTASASTSFLLTVN